MRGNVDHCVYYKQVGEHVIYVVVCQWHVIGWKQHGGYQGGENVAILQV